MENRMEMSNSIPEEKEEQRSGRRLLTWADILSSLICLGAIFPGLIVYNRLPEKIATNFDLNGEPQQYMTKAVFVFAVPVIAAAVQILLCLGTNFFFSNGKLDKVNAIIRFMDPAALYLGIIMMILYAMGLLTNMMAILGVFLSLTFIISGNYMPKMRRNFILGIRTPHTLADPQLWDMTHRFAGRLYIFGGILCIPVTLMEKYFALAAIAVLILIIPFAYSEAAYRFLRRKREENA